MEIRSQEKLCLYFIFVRWYTYQGPYVGENALISKAKGTANEKFYP